MKPYRKYRLIELKKGSLLLTKEIDEEEDDTPVIVISYPLENDDLIVESHLKVHYRSIEVRDKAFEEFGNDEEHLKELVGYLKQEAKNLIKQLQDENN